MCLLPSRVAAVVLYLSLVFQTPSLQARPQSSGKFDGPAELPRIYLRSSLADTPAPGKTRLVKGGDNLQQALNSVDCGDTLQLEAGATFSGIFRLRQKPCDDAHWIVIRTSAPDTDLPPEGTRLTPCFAGIASLPSRPDYHCNNPRNVLARITFSGGSFASGPIVLDNGANHYRLQGLELTRDAPERPVQNLVAPAAHSPTDHFVFDRLWVHGTARDETTRGIFLSGARYVSIVDSYFSDFHCVAKTGACVDSQAVAGGVGELPEGPFKVVNNFLEAAGESIIFGGGHATTTPADIEIRHNHLYKPPTWNPDNPTFVAGFSGNPFIVKNHFELKNAQRVLFEGNILENTWGGFSQTGFSILLTPKNQAPNICPLCQVTDVTLRYNRVAHTASGMQVANMPSDTGGASTAGERISIHDLLFEDMDSTKYKGSGAFAYIISNVPKMRDVLLDHITAFPPDVLFGIKGIRGEPKIINFTFRNSILGAGRREVISTGGANNCATGQRHTAAILENCFQDPGVTHNVIVGANSLWPKENYLVGSPSQVGFVNFNNGNGGNYHLCKTKEPPSCKGPSKYLKAGTDGKDLGADIDAIAGATSGAD
jgi:hypothetical protein